MDTNARSNIRFADNNTITAEGIGKVLITKKDGRTAFMSDVLYVPTMKNNLLSLGQLLEKGYTMSMQKKCIEVCDEKKRLLFTTPLSKNRTFRINLNVIAVQCMNVVKNDKEDWLWHYRYGHLNFRSLQLLGSNQMVSGLPNIQPPKKVCERFVMGKHHRKEFKKATVHRAKQPLGVVYADLCGPFSAVFLGGNR